MLNALFFVIKRLYKALLIMLVFGKKRLNSLVHSSNIRALIEFYTYLATLFLVFV